jgi:1-deoxy-D-xylulose-5-phosphate synthase
MTSTFKKIRAESEKFIIPTVIHVKTKKGLGLKSAEENPKDFHGVTGFSKSSGLPQKVSKSAPTYTDVFSQSLCRIAQKDPQVVAVTAAMTEGTGLSKFQKLFPQRFYDVGIAEQHAVTFAGALRLEGLKPAVAIYSTFLQRAYDQVIHDVALQKIPLALFLDRAGLVGADGPTHHGAFDLSFLRCVPNLVLMAPKDENELQHMVFTALNNGAFTAVRFPRGEGLGVTLDADFKMLKEGTSEKVFSESQNSEVCIWAVGSCVYPAIQAAQELALQGVNCEVVNARFIKPIDREALLKDAQSVKLLVSVEENSIVGGFGSAILEELSKSKLKTSTLQLGIPDNFIEHGSQSSQRQSCHIDSAGITQAVMKKIKHDQGK